MNKCEENIKNEIKNYHRTRAGNLILKKIFIEKHIWEWGASVSLI